MYKSEKSFSAHHQDCKFATNGDVKKLKIVEVKDCVMSSITRCILLYCRSIGLVMGQPLPMNGLVYGLMPTIPEATRGSIELAIDELTRLNIIDSRRALTRTGSDYLYNSLNQADWNVPPAQCRFGERNNSAGSFLVQTQHGTMSHV